MGFRSALITRILSICTI